MAVSSLAKFTELLSVYGTARDNQFVVNIQFPTDTSINDQEMVELYCESVTIPPRNITTNPVRQEHAFYEIPYGISYEPVTMTFYLDETMTVRDAFLKWYDMIYNSSNNGLNFYDSYSQTINIYSIDKKNIINTDYSRGVEASNWVATLINAYPKSIGDVQYRTSGDGQVLTLQVQFVYEKIEEGK
jgi:hypothetical protein